MDVNIAIDCNDPTVMVPFWAGFLHYEPPAGSAPHDFSSARAYYSLVDPRGRGPMLILQVVPEPVTVKNRLHLDLHVDDIAVEVQRAVDLGAEVVDTDPQTLGDVAWVRMTDPEGNLFCLVREST